MDALRQLTETINVFVRFFESINCLFLQLRWLQDNITRSNNSLLYLVSGVVVLCVLLMIIGESLRGDGHKDGIAKVIGQLIYDYAPIVLVVVIIIGFFRLRSLQNQRDPERSYEHVNAVEVDDEAPLQHDKDSPNRRRPLDVVAVASAPSLTIPRAVRL
jgi:hypothetical protein